MSDVVNALDEGLKIVEKIAPIVHKVEKIFPESGQGATKKELTKMVALGAVDLMGDATPGEILVLEKRIDAAIDLVVKVNNKFDLWGKAVDLFTRLMDRLFGGDEEELPETENPE